MFRCLMMGIDHEFETLPECKAAFLREAEHKDYKSIIGSLIWIQETRHHIIFSVLYLWWFTRSDHHEMSKYVISYLHFTKKVPLVLGGTIDIFITGYCDSSFGIGHHICSITGQVIKVNDDAGAVYAKISAGTAVKLFSFKSELDDLSDLSESVSRVSIIVDEVKLAGDSDTVLWNDSEATIQFINGHGSVRSVRNMDLSYYFTREEA